MTDWSPIHSAPLDGSEVRLAWCPNGQVEHEVVTRWSRAKEGWIGGWTGATHWRLARKKGSAMAARVRPQVMTERSAWLSYETYVTSKMGPQAQEWGGDDESRRLFTVWRQLRNERDAISQPQHKQNRMHAGRFSTRRM